MTKQHREQAPRRKQVETAVRNAKQKLLDTRRTDAVTAVLVRRVEAGIVALDTAHAAYVSALERRAKARKDAFRAERASGIAASQRELDEIARNPDASEQSKAIQRELHAMKVRSYDQQEAALATVAVIDDGFRQLGNRFVVVALEEAASKDGGRTLLGRLSKTTNATIAATGMFPVTAPFAAIAGLVKTVVDLAAGQLDKGPRPEPDERYEAAATWLAVATSLMDSWTAAVAAGSA